MTWVCALSVALVVSLSACGNSATDGGGPAPTPAVTSTAVSEESSGVEPSLRTDEVDPDSVLFIQGRIGADHQVSLTGSRRLAISRLPEPASGEYWLALDDLAGVEMARTEFKPINQADDSTIRARFSAAISPAPTGPIGTVRVGRGGEQLARIEGNASVPTVQVIKPVAGDSISIGEPQVGWRPVGDDGELTCFVYLSLDDGDTYQVASTGTAATELVIHPSLLSLTDAARLMVSVSDGINASHTISDRFTIDG